MPNNAKLRQNSMPTTRTMAYANSDCSVSLSIFGMENDGRCIVLREKRQNVSALFEYWAPKHATYTGLTQEEINANDDVFEAVTDLDTKRGQICLAILDFAHYALNHFDLDDEEDRYKMKNVALNCVKKKTQLDSMPFLLQANKDDVDMVKSCRLPFYEEILPPLIGKKRNYRKGSVMPVYLRFRRW